MERRIFGRENDVLLGTDREYIFYREECPKNSLKKSSFSIEECPRTDKQRIDPGISKKE